MLLVIVHNKVLETDEDRAYCQKMITAMSILSVIKIVINIIVSAVGSGGPANNNIKTG